MMKEIVKNNIIGFSIGLFMFLFFSIYLMKPTFLFEEDGSIRQFGIGNYKKTIIPVWLFSILLGIICYLTVLFYIRF
jgi:hypothetical protein